MARINHYFPGKKILTQGENMVKLHPKIIDVIALIRPSITFEEDMAADGSKTLRKPGVWSAAEITVDLNQFETAGHYDYVTVQFGGEIWHFSNATVALVPGFTPKDGEPNRYVLVFDAVNYSRK